MAVEVSPLNVLGGGPAPITSFADSMATGSSQGFNNGWVLIPTRYDIVPFAATIHGPKFNMGQPVTGGGLGLEIDNWGNGAGYVMSQAIVPRVIIPTLYVVKQQFVQMTWLRNSSQGCGMCAFLNLESLSGVGNENCDTYRLNMVNVAGNGFTLTRLNAGVANVDLAANIVALVSGDVIRMSVDSTNPAQTTIIIKQNGVVRATVNDNNANRVQFGWPGIYGEDTNNTSVNGLQAKLFSCGIGL